MEKGLIDLRVMIGAQDQGPITARPGKGAFDLLRISVASQPIAVVTAIGDEPFGFTPVSPRYCMERGFDERDRGGAGFEQQDRQRNARAVDHQQPLRSSGNCADALTCFLTEEKLPSMKRWLRSGWPPSSSSERKTRHMSFSFHNWSRRQQVEAMGYSHGGSRRRAPVLGIQRTSPRARWFSAQGWPRLFYFGRSCAIRCHCLSKRKGFRVPSFVQSARSKSPQKIYEPASKHRFSLFSMFGSKSGPNV